MKKNAGALGKVLFRMNVAFFTGLAVLILALLLTEGRTTPHWMLPLLGIAGIVPAFGSLFYGWAYFRCPNCNASLMPHKRIPMSIPAYCSSCGAKLNENE